MAETGYNWGAWGYVQKAGPANIDAHDLDDEATLTSLEIDLDGKAACQAAVKWVEGNDGAVDGDLYIYLLEYDGEDTWQTINDAVQKWTLDVVQNATRILTFSIDPKHAGGFKLLFDNDSGQDGDLTVSFRTATIPAAS